MEAELEAERQREEARQKEKQEERERVKRQELQEKRERERREIENMNVRHALTQVMTEMHYLFSAVWVRVHMPEGPSISFVVNVL